MAYARRAKHPALGWVAAIPVAIQAFSTIEKSLFGAGASRDQIRDARAQWFTTAAENGSLTAARILVAGLTKTGGVTKEIARYTAGIAAVRASGPAGNDLMDRAYAAGGFWIDGDNDTSDQMRAAVTRELNEMAAAIPESYSGVTQGPVSNGGLPYPTHAGIQSLPPVHTVAPFNWTPYAFAGGVALLILYFSDRH